MQKRINNGTAKVNQERDSQTNMQIRKETEESLSVTHDSHPLENVSCRIGDSACAARHVSVIQRTGLFHPMNEGQRVQSLLRLQRQYGNRFVQRVIAQHAIQTKLKIGQPGDIYEREADQVAEQVIQMPEPQVQRQPEEEEKEESLQTKPLAEQITPLVQRQVEEKEEEQSIQARPPDGALLHLQEEEPKEEEEEPIQTKLADSAQVQRQEDEPEEEEEEPVQANYASGKTPQAGSGLEVRIRTLKGGGQPLPESTRAFFEPRFSYDFSQVRVHADAEADTLNRALNASAFTTGQDIFFLQGVYNSGSSGGRELLAHELTHVMQQNGDKLQRKFTMSQLGNRVLVTTPARCGYTNTRAVGTARTLNPRAFIFRQNVVFDARQYAPEKAAGKQLLAHELTYVVQQGAGAQTKCSRKPKTAKIWTSTLRNWIQRKAKRFKPKMHWGGISYRRLLADKRLDIGVTIGYPFLGEYRRLIAYLKKRRFTRIGSTLLETFRILSGVLFPISGNFLKKGVERWKRIKRFWLRASKRGKKRPIDVDVIIDIINQETKDPKKHFSDFLKSKEVAIYSGHARYGTGPDFDSKKSVKENFIIGVNSALHKTGKLIKGYSPEVNKALVGKANDLEAMSKAGRFDPKLYQIWFFNACTSVHYLDEIRGGLAKGKDSTNLRVVGTTKPISIDATLFIDGILKQQTMSQILKRLNKAESAYRGEKKVRSRYFSD